MLGYKVKWFLFVSSFVCCAFIVIDAQDDSQKFEEVRYILKNYQWFGQFDHLVTHLSHEYGDLCDLYVSRCSAKNIDGLSLLVTQSYRETEIRMYQQIAAPHYAKMGEEIPKLSEYAEYCQSRVIKYCVDNIDEVGFFLLAGVSENKRELVRHLLESLRKGGIRGNVDAANVKKAFSELKKSLYPDREISADEERKLLRNVHYALFFLRGVYSSFKKYLSIEGQGSVAPSGDILLADWFNLEGLDKVVASWLPEDGQLSAPDWYGWYYHSDGFDDPYARTGWISFVQSMAAIKLAEESPERMEEMLQNTDDKRKMIGIYSVGALRDRCELTLDKCVPMGGYRKLETKRNSLIDGDLKNYADYCHEKVKTYCSDNVRQASRLALTNISEDDKRLARLFLQFFPKEKLNGLDFTVEDVLDALKTSIEAEKTIYSNIGIDFSARTVNAFGKFEYFYLFYERREYTKPTEGHDDSPGDDPLITEFFKLSRLAKKTYLPRSPIQIN